MTSEGPDSVARRRGRLPVGNGKVATSVVQENTTKDSIVGNCIAKAVKRWKFPRVGNGGTALVSYPFRLSAH